MVYRYVPILRWKRGERFGVKHLSTAGRRDVLPLFVLGTEQYVGREATKSRPAITPPNVFSADLYECYGNATFFLDAMAIPHGAHHPLIDIAKAARAKGLGLIPATRLNAPTAYQAAVSSIVEADQRGVALRVDLNEFASVASWIGGWPHAMADTDLIGDFADSISTVKSLGAALDPVFSGLHQGKKWRSVTLAGTSMPANFAGIAAGAHKIGRAEIALWQRLVSISLPYRLDYGDWATVPVVPPPAGIKWGYPINVKYTLAKEFIVCRGVSTTGPLGVDADVQLVGHAKTISKFPGRGALSTCWGDQRIDAIASGTEGPSGLEHWVRISVNRHIEVTRHHLA